MRMQCGDGHSGTTLIACGLRTLQQGLQACAPQPVTAVAVFVPISALYPSNVYMCECRSPLCSMEPNV